MDEEKNVNVVIGGRTYRATVGTDRMLTQEDLMSVVTARYEDPSHRETLNRLIAGAVYDFAESVTDKPSDASSMATAATQFLAAKGCAPMRDPDRRWPEIIPRILSGGLARANEEPKTFHEKLVALLKEHGDETDTWGELFVAFGEAVAETEDEMTEPTAPTELDATGAEFSFLDSLVATARDQPIYESAMDMLHQHRYLMTPQTYEAFMRLK